MTDNLPDISADLPEIQESDEISEVQEEIGLDTSVDFQIETDLQIQQAVDAIQQIENLDPSSWQSLDVNSRLEIVQNLENRMADIQDRPGVPVSVDETLPDNVFGVYNGQDISINVNHLQSGMALDEFINTIVHEGRHAYQDYAIQNPGFVSDLGTVNAWTENLDSYLDPDLYGQELYANQSIEADAFAYANRISNALIASSLER